MFINKSIFIIFIYIFRMKVELEEKIKKFDEREKEFKE